MRDLTLYAVVKLKVKVPKGMDNEEAAEEVGANFEYEFNPPEDSAIKLVDTEWVETNESN